MTNYEPISDWRIRINGNEHGVPHVHVLFRDGSRVSVAIETRTTLSGFVIPAKRLMPALAVIKANKQIYTSRGHNLRIYPPSGGRGFRVANCLCGTATRRNLRLASHPARRG